MVMQNKFNLKISNTDSGLRFKVSVIPNSSCSKIVEITEEFIKIKLNSPPIEGKANKEVIAILSKFLKIPKSNITIISGDKNKLKTIEAQITEEVFFTKLNELDNSDK